MMTPNENKIEEVIKRKEYKAIYLSEIYNIIIEKTNKNINIRSIYYQLKLDKEQMSALTNTIFNSIDETFEFIINIFNQNKYYITGITSNSLILRIQTYDIKKRKQKEIELYLNQNFEDKNYLIKELFNKYIKLEKDIIKIKNENKKLIGENDKLNKDNINLKMEIESIKNNQINGINMQIANISNIIYQIQQQIIQIQNQINSLPMTMNMNQLNLNEQISVNNIQDNNIQSKNNNNINVRFRWSGGYDINNNINTELMSIQCNSKESTKELIQKWRKKYNIYEKKNIQFIYNARALPECEHSSVEEFGIYNNAQISIIITHQIIG